MQIQIDKLRFTSHSDKIEIEHRNEDYFWISLGYFDKKEMEELFWIVEKMMDCLE